MSDELEKIPPYMCFIDLQKAYDSVDRELLRMVLASLAYQRRC